MRLQQKAFIYTALSGVLYGTIGYFGAKLNSLGLSMPNLLLWRFLLSTLCLLPLLKRTDWQDLSWRPACWSFFLGFLCYGLSTLSFFYAIPMVGSGIAMVLFFLFPVVVAILTYIVDKKPLNVFEILALILILPGIALLACSQDARFDVRGIGLGIICALAYGVYFFGSKKVGQGMSSNLMGTLVSAGNLVWFALLCLCQGDTTLPNTWEHIYLILGLAVVGTALPLILVLRAFKHLSATKVAILSVLEPITTVLIGVLALQETLSPYQLTGIAIMLASALIAQWEPSTKVLAEEVTP